MLRRTSEALQTPQAFPGEELPFDEDLFEKLRRLRTRLASEKGIPPYMVFANRTLRSMAATRPIDPSALLLCPGVGRKKLEVYGEDFLRVIRADE